MRLPPFVDADWLEEHRDEVVLADVRFYLDGRSARSSYEAGHLPGAVFVAMEGVLAAAPGDGRGGRHPLPSPEAFADGLSAVGIGDGTRTVAYDDAGGVIAARLVWMLRCVGHEAALLDGGLDAFAGELESGPGTSESGPGTSVSRARLRPRAWPEERLAGIEDVAAPGTAVLLDARDPGRFAGDPDPVDPRSGHIPGARNLPARGLADGRHESPAALRARFAAVGVSGETPVIAYCGSGVTACFDLLALERAELGVGRLFPGSWSQWSRDPTRRVET